MFSSQINIRMQTRLSFADIADLTYQVHKKAINIMWSFYSPALMQSSPRRRHTLGAVLGRFASLAS